MIRDKFKKIKQFCKDNKEIVLLGGGTICGIVLTLLTEQYLVSKKLEKTPLLNAILMDKDLKTGINNSNAAYCRNSINKGKTFADLGLTNAVLDKLISGNAKNHYITDDLLVNTVLIGYNEKREV